MDTSTPVPGEVEAADKPFGNSTVTEKELAKNVLSLPGAVRGKLLGSANRQVVPSQKAGHVVKCSMERQGTKGGLTLPSIPSTTTSSQPAVYAVMDSSNQPYAGGVVIQETKAPALVAGVVPNIAGGSGDRYVMLDANQKPFCLAQRDKSSGSGSSGKLKIPSILPTPGIQKQPAAFLIKGTEPLCGIEAPDDKEELVDFYPWFKLVDAESLHVWNGNEYQPVLRIVKSNSSSGSGSGTTLLGEAVDKLAPLVVSKNADLKVVDVQDAGKVYGLLSKKKATDHGWQVCAAPGTDVTLMIMLAALMDDMVGWFA